MLEKMLYIVQATIMTITPGHMSDQKCINNPVSCWTYELHVIRFNHDNSNEAYMNYWIMQHDTLLKNRWEGKVITGVHLDSMKVDSETLKYWIGKTGEIRPID